jgi:hypothetical protein
MNLVGGLTNAAALAAGVKIIHRRLVTPFFAVWGIFLWWCEAVRPHSSGWPIVVNKVEFSPQLLIAQAKPCLLVGYRSRNYPGTFDVA